MSTKKPSLTKQIAEVLESEDKRVQLERIEQLKKVSQAPTVAVTVLFAQGKTQLTIVGTARATPEDIKFILQQGIDEITAQVVRQQLQAESGEQEPEGVPPEAVDPPE